MERWLANPAIRTLYSQARNREKMLLVSVINADMSHKVVKKKDSLRGHADKLT
jgi:hypothetical protein